MPRVYKPSSPHSTRSNAGKKYRQSTKHLTRLQAAEATPGYQADASTSLIPLQPPTADIILADDHSPPYDDVFSHKQVALLQAYLRWPHDPEAHAVELCESVGYHPDSLSNAHALLRIVLERMMDTEDLHRMSRLMGMAESWWLRRIFQVAQCGSPRVEVQALKLAGLAIGAFDDPHPSAGARIIIEAAADDGKAAVRVSVGSAAESPDSSGVVSFQTAKPSRRRKVLRNLS